MKELCFAIGRSYIKNWKNLWYPWNRDQEGWLRWLNIWIGSLGTFQEYSPASKFPRSRAWEQWIIDASFGLFFCYNSWADEGFSFRGAMDSMVEENGNSSIDPLTDQQSPSEANSGAVLTTAANIVQFIPTQAVQVVGQHQQFPTNYSQNINPHLPQSQSVIQANQSSVIQTATNLQPMTLAKGVLYVNKSNSVIHTAPAGLQVKVQRQSLTPFQSTLQTFQRTTNNPSSISSFNR